MTAQTPAHNVDFRTPGPPERAYAEVSSALVRAGGAVTAAQPPGIVDFTYKYNDFMRTGFLGAAMKGRLNIDPSAEALCGARVSLSVDWGANKAYLALLAIGTVALVFGVLAYLDGSGGELRPAGVMLVALIVIGLSALILWRFAGLARLARRRLILQLTQAPPAPGAAQAFAPTASVTPALAVPPATAPPAFVGAAPPPSAPSAPLSAAAAPAGSDVVQKLTKLAELRDLELITPAEYDAGKEQILRGF